MFTQGFRSWYRTVASSEKGAKRQIYVRSLIFSRGRAESCSPTVLTHLFVTCAGVEKTDASRYEEHDAKNDIIHRLQAISGICDTFTRHFRQLASFSEKVARFPGTFGAQKN